MKLIKHKREHGCKISMASLIDVVFLLIIFFMTVSHITVNEAKELELAEAKSGEKPFERENTALILNLDKNGKLWLGSENISIELLGEKITQQAGESGVAHIKAILRVDRSTEWKYPRTTLNQLKNIGLQNIKVRVVDPQ